MESLHRVAVRRGNWGALVIGWGKGWRNIEIRDFNLQNTTFPPFTLLICLNR
jgi:hypothetical protein